METILQTQIVQPIFQKIYEIRGQKVMLDFDLAELYGVENKHLKRAVNRNIKRFPPDFMFQLSQIELNSVLRCQIGTAKSQIIGFEENNRGESQLTALNKVRFLPYAFTEHGISMLSSVLRSEKAIETNIAIVRTFITLRQYALNYADLSSRLDEFMASTDTKFEEVFDVLTELTAQKKLYENRRPIGFVVRDEAE